MAIVDVVKYNGGPDVLAWKYPSEELGTWTQLIVNESQEAILFKGGKALDVFESGRHTLSTANIPVLNKIVNLPFGGRSPFTAEVWYINKLFSLDIKWGTATPIQIQDPKYGVFVPIRSNGMFGVQIEDSKKFLVKLVGTMGSFDKNTLVKYFRGLYITKAKDAISSYVINKKISILEINAYIDELSSFMKERIEPVMEEYGIRLLNFYVNDISLPEDDPAVSKLKEALAKRAEMNIIGYSYQQERSFNTLEGAAKNPGSSSSQIMGAGLGLGMGVGLGGTVGNAFGSISGEINTSNKSAMKKCPNCHDEIDADKRFCGICGFDTSQKEEKKEEKKRLTCSNCGCDINENVKFCPECGNKYNPCPECGYDMEEGATKCAGCGYELPKKCPKCGNNVPANVKFCPECGEMLAARCTKCNAIVEGNPKFCPECGEKLQ
ncbi:Membrane protease subunit, stomatin/prohibitin family, contains C-terminal Zn-ribbon domain [Clostridium cadaveris]|uniref:Membrane protease subunit, stomatin/prohibitin family, contains C-terminal Zn-ribbon domain n=2 Tax=Clostridium cadaveris TaxID=1529 RepID=A0A1I2N254_9CLOT|nr:SPFH domain-containing protein [Clostridium cadaveris]MDM8312381.1 SPFH domain-containing protein [Clostridium cadaveris]MDU4952235.1 SPFH domain-containing protein [Clostridium sp.]UFH64145.1 SPFH domain-containing protein [Clostridium cadaveris]SFF97478.1 Membrane protease subunit, stomatin/prohibitin family, contains C-terminal Zn-ribbon domain [Clostridium cadaveris]